MKPAAVLLLVSFCCPYVPPRADALYPTHFTVTFTIHRVNRHWVLPNGEIAGDRNKDIIEQYAAGQTLQQIAKTFGISYQRVHQIIHQSDDMKTP